MEDATFQDMIFDACVLLDYLKTDRTIFTLFEQYLGNVHVEMTTFEEEIRDIEESDDLKHIKITIIEPDVEDVFAAGAARGGALSFYDRLCFLTAKRKGFTCVTNDKKLRRICEDSGVPVLWGIQLLVMLHDAGDINPQKALKIAKRIRMLNPGYIRSDIIKNLEQELGL